MEFTVIVKRECETCQMVVPVLEILRQRHELTLYCQDDPSFPEALGGARDDTALEQSWRLGVEAVPTLIRLDNGAEHARIHGWDRSAWRQITGIGDLGAELPAFRPGCGSRSVEPGMPERLALRYGGLHFASRVIEVSEDEDPIEVAYDRGWSDGLPITPPTALRVARMLAGTSRRADEVIGLIRPTSPNARSKRRRSTL